MLEEPGNKTLRPLAVNIDELIAAAENTSIDMLYFLDLETGAVVLVRSDTNSELQALCEKLAEAGDTECQGLARAVAESDLSDWQKLDVLKADEVEAGFGKRLVRVPQTDSHEAYGVMQDFIPTVRSDRLQEQLWDAIHGRGPFRRFKAVLGRDRKELERWFKFKDEAMCERMIDWLHSEGIEPMGLEPEDNP